MEQEERKKIELELKIIDGDFILHVNGMKVNITNPMSNAEISKIPHDGRMAIGAGAQSAAGLIGLQIKGILEGMFTQMGDDGNDMSAGSWTINYLERALSLARTQHALQAQSQRCSHGNEPTKGEMTEMLSSLRNSLDKLNEHKRKMEEADKKETIN